MGLTVARGRSAPDEAGVIRSYYFKDKSLTHIAEQANLSRSWLCRRHVQAMGRLTRRIKGLAWRFFVMTDPVRMARLVHYGT